MEKTEYAPGTPTWIDLGAPDVARASAFYGSLFGWTAEAADPVEETGGYHNFTYQGRRVAGLGPAQNPGPPYWTSYFAVTDADAAVAKAKELGGTCFVEAMDVMDQGRMAVLADPTGAAFSVWQAGAHKGAELVNEANTWCWNELSTRDLATAKAFYRDLLDAGLGGADEYVELQVEGESVAGMMAMPEMVPAEVPPYWLVYIAVEDTDASVARAQELGATLVAGPMEVPVGRFAVLADDQGAMFAVIKMTDGAHG
jgi:predicted enzyme related to lactoylglutathione lyase